ncbi:MAG: hypothetical protein ABIN99_10270 [Nitrosospira sp.]
MRKTKLIDIFGLSRDPLDNALVDDLLFRLESEGPSARGNFEAPLPAINNDNDFKFKPEAVLSTPNEHLSGDSL